jgi:hypothetical protein
MYASKVLAVFALNAALLSATYVAPAQVSVGVGIAAAPICP